MAAALVSSHPAFVAVATEHPAFAAYSGIPASVSISSLPATLVWYQSPFTLGDSSGYALVDSSGNLLAL